MMTQYINKSALVAEIVRKMNRCKKILLDLRTRQNKDYYQGKREAYIDILSFLDTLEVKEVDLDMEVALWANAIPEIQLDDVTRLAKYFFELGLKTKGE